MNQREHFLTVIDYEKWANELWIDFLETAPQHPNGAQLAAKGDEIMGHIIGRYWHWFNLLSGTNVELTGDRRVDLAAQHKKMLEFVSVCDLDLKIQRTWDEYGTYEFLTHQLVQHALSHGSYHRGHLRAVAEAHGFEEWPDTDFEVMVGRKIS